MRNRLPRRSPIPNQRPNVISMPSLVPIRVPSIIYMAISKIIDSHLIDVIMSPITGNRVVFGFVQICMLLFLSFLLLPFVSTLIHHLLIHHLTPADVAEAEAEAEAAAERKRRKKQAKAACESAQGLWPHGFRPHGPWPQYSAII